MPPTFWEAPELRARGQQRHRPEQRPPRDQLEHLRLTALFGGRGPGSGLGLKVLRELPGVEVIEAGATVPERGVGEVGHCT